MESSVLQQQTIPAAVQMEKPIASATSTVTTTTAPNLPAAETFPSPSQPYSTTVVSAATGNQQEKLSNTTGITRSHSLGNVASGAQPASSANLIREQPIVREVTEKPVLAEVVHRPSVEVHRRQVITEVHEKPQVEFREVPMVVTTREQPLYRQFAEKMRVEDFTSRELIQNPYTNVAPKILQETPITSEVQEGVIIREIHEQPIIEIHHQPVIREIHEKPIIEIHEQEIIRKYTDTPIVRVTRVAEQIIQQNVTQAPANMSATSLGPGARTATPYMGTSGIMTMAQQGTPSAQPIGQQVFTQPIQTQTGGSYVQAQPLVSSSFSKQPVLVQEPISTSASLGMAPSTSVSQSAPSVSIGSPTLSSTPAVATQSYAQPSTVTMSQPVSNSSNTIVQTSVNQALAEAPPVYVERRPSFTDKFKRAIGI